MTISSPPTTPKMSTCRFMLELWKFSRELRASTSPGSASFGAKRVDRVDRSRPERRDRRRGDRDECQSRNHRRQSERIMRANAVEHRNHKPSREKKREAAQYQSPHEQVDRLP